MNKIIFVLLLLVFLPYNVNAYHEVIDARCTNSLKMKLREEAQEVAYRLTQVDNGVVSYTAYFYNMTENLVIKDVNNNVYSANKIDNLKPGSTLTISIYATNKNYCSGYKVLSKIINVPYYNPYFGSDLCIGNEKLYLCQEHTNVTLNEEEFKEKIESYKEKLKKDEEEIVEDVVKEYNLSLFDIFIKYRYYILSFLIFIFVILEIITIKMKKRRGIL